MEELVQKVMGLFAETDGQEVYITSVDQGLLSEILSLSEEAYENFCVILEAEMILAKRKIKDLDDLGKLRKAFILRNQDQPVPVKEILPDFPGSMELMVPAGYNATRDGIVREGARISSCPFFIGARTKSAETGRGNYVLLIKFADENVWREISVSANPAGIIKTVQTVGVYVDVKGAKKYIEEYLAANWAKLPVLSPEPEDEMGALYERFLEFVAMHQAEFDDKERWGRFIMDEKSGQFVAILRGPLERFLREVGKPDRRSLLRAWRDQGLLLPAADGRFTRSVRVNKAVLRAYMIRLPEDIDFVTPYDERRVTVESLPRKDLRVV